MDFIMRKVLYNFRDTLYHSHIFEIYQIQFYGRYTIGKITQVAFSQGIGNL